MWVIYYYFIFVEYRLLNRVLLIIYFFLNRNGYNKDFKFFDIIREIYSLNCKNIMIKIIRRRKLYFIKEIYLDMEYIN